MEQETKITTLSLTFLDFEQFKHLQEISKYSVTINLTEEQIKSINSGHLLQITPIYNHEQRN